MDQHDAGNNSENNSPLLTVEDASEEEYDVKRHLKSYKEALLVRFQFILYEINSEENRYVTELGMIQYYLGAMENDEFLNYCGERIIRCYIRNVQNLMSKDIVSDSSRLNMATNNAGGADGANAGDRDLDPVLVARRHEEIKERCVEYNTAGSASEESAVFRLERGQQRGQQRRQPTTHAAGSDSNTDEHGQCENGERNERLSNAAAAEQGSSRPVERSNTETATPESPERTAPQNIQQAPPVQIPLVAATQAPPTLTDRNHPLYGQLHMHAAANAFPLPFYTREAFENRSYAESAAGMLLASALNMMAASLPNQFQPPPPPQANPSLRQPRIHHESSRPLRQPHPNQLKRPREAISSRSRSRESTRGEPEASRHRLVDGYYDPSNGNVEMMQPGPRYYNRPNGASNSNRSSSTTNYGAAAGESRSASQSRPSSSSRSSRNREESSRRRSREEKKKAKEDQRSTAHAIVQSATASQKLAGRGRSMT